MARGDHIIVGMGRVDHHGCDIGDGTVVHWSSGVAGEKSIADKSARKRNARILRTPITRFGDLARVRIRRYGSCFDAETVV
jgi:hypothetical protein